MEYFYGKIYSIKEGIYGDTTLSLK